MTVVDDRGEVVLVCKPEEYAAAMAERRAPIAVGFHREDVLEVVTISRKGASLEAGPARSSMAGD